MRAFQNIRDEMREACVAVSRLATDEAPEIARVAKADDDQDDGESAVAPWMEEAFRELVTACLTGEPFLLVPCTVNGEPTAIIGHVNNVDDRRGQTHVTPLFVAVTRGMVVVDSKGRRAWGDDDGGDRGDVGGGGSSASTADAPAPR